MGYTIIAIISIAGTLIAGLVIHLREREADKNGNGFNQLKRLIDK